MESTPGEAGIDELEYEALTPIWEDALLDSPGDVVILAWLGHAYTRTGRVEEGLQMDLRLVGALPDDPVVRYNLACSYALLEHRDESFDALREAFRLGYRDVEHLLADPDLASIRGDPRFEGLVGPFTTS